MFVIRCALLCAVICCVLFAVCCGLWFAVRRASLLLVVCWASFAFVRCLLCVLLFVDNCLLASGVPCLMFVVCRWLFVVCCLAQLSVVV